MGTSFFVAGDFAKINGCFAARHWLLVLAVCRSCGDCFTVVVVVIVVIAVVVVVVVLVAVMVVVLIGMLSGERKIALQLRQTTKKKQGCGVERRAQLLSNSDHVHVPFYGESLFRLTKLFGLQLLFVRKVKDDELVTGLHGRLQVDVSSS